jgi:hypothetical protein
MKALIFVSLGLLVTALPAAAVAILAPTDQIIGGQRQGSQFVVGTVGTAAGVNNWPAAEPPSDLINGFKGGAGEKYLNFAELDTGVIITPALGAGVGGTILTSMTLSVANDAEPRDPASFELLGTNVTIAGGGPFNMGDFTLIDLDALALPAERDITLDTFAIGQFGGNTEVTVPIGGTVGYTSYMLLFPTVKDAGLANSMQISELQFDGRVVPEPGSAALIAAAIGLAGRRRQRKN